ncbi:hypothetical protein LCGC14_2917840 [marine sediment metagenome]|uniref:Uncharacterized protein n=1 Tax=marine sediment metagenome TaxID=412755 RepID=A0A0F8YBK9_9ZZZZ
MAVMFARAPRRGSDRRRRTGARLLRRAGSHCVMPTVLAVRHTAEVANRVIQRILVLMMNEMAWRYQAVVLNPNRPSAKPPARDDTHHRTRAAALFVDVEAGSIEEPTDAESVTGLEAESVTGLESDGGAQLGSNVGPTRAAPLVFATRLALTHIALYTVRQRSTQTAYVRPYARSTDRPHNPVRSTSIVAGRRFRIAIRAPRAYPNRWAVLSAP